MDLLTVVRQCHNDDPWNDKELVPLYLTQPPQGAQIGFLSNVVWQTIRNDVRQGTTDAFCFASDGTSVWINPSLQSNQAVSEELKKVVEGWRARDLFPDPLKGWRDELYSIYGPDRKEAFKMERSACALFGFATFGVHATAYTPDYRIWVPRRAKDKSTWPGYLDNSVAGGITAGDGQYESMVRECGEEAGLPDRLVRKVMRQTGVISYFYRTPSGWRQPEVEYTYDIPLPSDVLLRPVDGEAESFELMDRDRILDLIRRGQFKPNCALVLIDFFIRHGQLTAENCDCNYTKLVCALHNDLRLPGP